MSLKLVLFMSLGAILLILLATYFLRKGRIPEKYALLWYVFALIILLFSVFPNIFYALAKAFGFVSPSNMLMLALIAILFMLVMALTIMMAGQKKKSILLIQELSLQKLELDRIKRGNK